jgi:Sec-independent protein secretion pathway component TatC
MNLEAVKYVILVALIILPIVFSYRLGFANEASLREWRSRVYALVPLKSRTFARIVRGCAVILFLIGCLMAWILLAPFLMGSE